MQQLNGKSDGGWLFLLLGVFDGVVLVFFRTNQVDQSDHLHLQWVEGPKDEAEQEDTGEGEEGIFCDISIYFYSHG